MSGRRARCDVVIVGAGITGLWTRALLERRGFSTILIERDSLGAGQTIASQGILHAGLKYVVSGETDGASALLAAEHDRWLDRLRGRIWPDLTGVPVLAERVVMWSTPSLASRATAWLASPMMRSASRKLAPAERPEAFQGAPAGVGVWHVEEPAVDARSLIHAISRQAAGPMLRAHVSTIRSFGDGVDVACAGAELQLQIRARAAVLAAGSGAATLLAADGVDPESVCQERPLRMVVARGAPAPIFGHCIQPSSKPRLTITSAREDDAWLWYIGGALAEPPATQRSPAEQITFAREELAACLSWLDLSGLRLESRPISRAEGLTPRGRRPEGPVIYQRDRTLAVWPTKLAMAPVAAEQSLERIGAMIENPAPAAADELAGLAPPALGEPVWSRSPQT